MNRFISNQSKELKKKLFKVFHRIPNSTSYWHLSDKKDRFEENFKKHPTSPHLLNYKKNPITYEYNNYGFRTPDDFILKQEGNVFLGCSHTFGIGHYLENTWSYKLSKKIGGKFYNISEPGSGIQLQYEYLNYFKDKIKFNNLFHFLPDECWVRFNPTTKEMLVYNNFEPDDLVKIYLNLILDLCKSLGVNYYLLTKSYLRRNLNDSPNIDAFHPNWNPARDLSHYYSEEHDEICSIFYEKFLNNDTAKHQEIKKEIFDKLI